MIIQASNETGGALRLTVMAGNLDISNASAFREETTPLVSASTGIVEVDCAEMEFIDSSGVGALLYLNKLLPAERRPIRLIGVGRKVMTLLELMHVHRSFEFEPRS